jgi:hypothetical protein
MVGDDYIANGMNSQFFYINKANLPNSLHLTIDTESIGWRWFLLRVEMHGGYQKYKCIYFFHHL